MKTWVPLILTAGLAALLSTSIPKNLTTAGLGVDPSERARVNYSALGRVLGEFRTGTSDLLFVKTERYLHGGIGYATHDMGPDEEGNFSHADTAHHADTLIPDARGDYRQWIGHMHREVKPWKPPGVHAEHGDGTELIPWFRMMTLTDPGYIQGYLAGAFWIQNETPDQAMLFINEGIEKNPQAFRLYYTKAMLQLRAIRTMDPDGLVTVRLPEQKTLMEKARLGLQHSVDLMLKELPDDRDVHDPDVDLGWSVYKESDAIASSYMAVLIENRYGDATKAESMKQRILEAIPTHPRLSR